MVHGGGGTYQIKIIFFPSLQIIRTLGTRKRIGSYREYNIQYVYILNGLQQTGVPLPCVTAGRAVYPHEGLPRIPRSLRRLPSYPKFSSTRTLILLTPVVVVVHNNKQYSAASLYIYIPYYCV